MCSVQVFSLLFVSVHPVSAPFCFPVSVYLPTCLICLPACSSSCKPVALFPKTTSLYQPLCFHLWVDSFWVAVVLKKGVLEMAQTRKNIPLCRYINHKVHCCFHGQVCTIQLYKLWCWRQHAKAAVAAVAAVNFPFVNIFDAFLMLSWWHLVKNALWFAWGSKLKVKNLKLECKDLKLNCDLQNNNLVSLVVKDFMNDFISSHP